MKNLNFEVENIKKDKTLSTSDKLDKIAMLYSKYDFMVTSRTESQLQLSRKKTFSFFWALIWFLVVGIGILVYIFYYMSKKDEVVIITLSKSMNSNITTKNSSSKTVIQTNQLDYVKNKIGSREQYHNVIKYHTFSRLDQDILLQASVSIRKEKPDQTLIKKAYTILSKKESEVLSLPSDKLKEKDIRILEINKEENIHFSIADEILKLISLKDDGIISQEDFLVQKDKLLNQ